MQELMERNNDGLFVELVWMGGKEIGIRVKDGNNDEVFVKVKPEDAMDAFEHPFIYLKDAETVNSDIVAKIEKYK